MPESTSSRQPNVVWIMADQLRADSVGFAGNEIVQTPNLDRLANRGVVFDQLYPQASVCVPSRSCMITGRYLRNLQLDNASTVLPPQYPTMPEVFQRGGYRTSMTGKIHLTPQQYTRDTLGTHHAILDPERFLGPAGLGPMPDDPVKRNYGFEQVNAPHEDALWGDYADWLAQRDPQLAAKMNEGGARWPAGEVWEPLEAPGLGGVGQLHIDPKLHPSWFIGQRAAQYFEQHLDEPCFMHVGFVDPHHPWDPPAEIMKQYPPEQMPLPPCSDPGNVVWPESLLARTRDFSQFSDQVIRFTIAAYYAMIDQLDRSLGPLLESIERSGQMDDTIFVFVADHGELLGDYGLWQKGSYHYDSIIRVPGFISYPNGLNAQRVDGLVEAIDLAPTVLDLAGLDVPESMQGRVLGQRLNQGADVGRDQVWCELYTTTRGPFVDCWTVRTPSAKLNWFPQDRLGHLFDLEADPLERKDVFAEPGYRPLRDEMVGRMFQAINDQKDPLPRTLSQY